MLLRDLPPDCLVFAEINGRAQQIGFLARPLQAAHSLELRFPREAPAEWGFPGVTIASIVVAETRLVRFSSESLCWAVWLSGQQSHVLYLVRHNDLGFRPIEEFACTSISR